MEHEKCPWRLLLPWMRGCQSEALTEGVRVPVTCGHRTMPLQQPVQMIRLIEGWYQVLGGQGQGGWACEVQVWDNWAWSCRVRVVHMIGWGRRSVPWEGRANLSVRDVGREWRDFSDLKLRQEVGWYGRGPFLLYILVVVAAQVCHNPPPPQ